MPRTDRDTDGLDTAHRDAGAANTGRPTRRSPPLRRFLVSIDMAVVGIGWFIVMVVALNSGEVTFGPLTAIAHVVTVLGAGALLLSAAGLYRRRICAIRAIELARIGRVSLGLAATSVVLLASIGREFALLGGIVGGVAWFLLLAAERGVLREWISSRRANGDFGAPVLVVGGEPTGTLETARFLAENPMLGYRVIGVSCPGLADLEDTFPSFGAEEDVLERLHRSGGSGVLLDAASLSPHELNGLVQRCVAAGVHVHISSGVCGIDVRRISVSPMADETFLYIAPSESAEARRG